MFSSERRGPRPDLAGGPLEDEAPVTTFRYSHPVEVRFRDCDALNHVNNAVYFTYLEVARFAYWRDVVGDASVSALNFIIAHAECDYRAAAASGERLAVRLAITHLGRSSFTFEYEIAGQDGRLVATARTVQVMYDYAAGRPMPVPDALRARVEQFEREGA
jgi:acyl-CoA thioester hydrolase